MEDLELEYGEATARTEQRAINMPAPTYWPMALAFGIALLFLGLVTTSYVSMAGLLIAIRGAFGWWGTVLPAEQEEAVAISSVHRPSPVITEGRSVAGAKAGESGGRHRYPERVHPYTAGAAGGLAGAVAMAVLACAYGLFAQHSLWYPINLLAGVVIPHMGSESLEQLRSFQALPFFAALVGHVMLSLMVGLVYAVILPMFPRFAPFWAGILMPLVWSGLIGTTLEILDPALTSRINWMWFVICQLGFGLVCGFVISRSTSIPTAEWWGRAQHGGRQSGDSHG